MIFAVSLATTKITSENIYDFDGLLEADTEYLESILVKIERRSPVSVPVASPVLKRSRSTLDLSDVTVRTFDDLLSGDFLKMDASLDELSNIVSDPKTPTHLLPRLQAVCETAIHKVSSGQVSHPAPTVFPTAAFGVIGQIRTILEFTEIDE